MTIRINAEIDRGEQTTICLGGARTGRECMILIMIESVMCEIIGECDV